MLDAADLLRINGQLPIIISALMMRSLLEMRQRLPPKQFLNVMLMQYSSYLRIFMASALSGLKNSQLLQERVASLLYCPTLNTKTKKINAYNVLKHNRLDRLISSPQYFVFLTEKTKFINKRRQMNPKMSAGYQQTTYWLLLDVYIH